MVAVGLGWCVYAIDHGVDKVGTRRRMSDSCGEISREIRMNNCVIC